MQILYLLAVLATGYLASGYVIHDLHHPRYGGIQSIPTETHSVMPSGTPMPDVQKYILDGNKYVGDSCYRITDEYEVTLNVSIHIIPQISTR